MKIIPFLLFILLFCLCASSETSAQKKKTQMVKVGVSGDYEKVFTKIELNATFPGGANAWFLFASNNLDYGAVMATLPAGTTVYKDSAIVKFIIDKSGTLSDFEALKGDPALTDAFIRLLQQSPAWQPANQCGRKVKSYKMLRLDVFIDLANHVNTIQRYKGSYDYFNINLVK